MFCLTSQYLGLQNRQSSLVELKVHLEVYNAKAYFMIWENITYSHYCSRSESEIDVGPGKFGKKTRRPLNKHSVYFFTGKQ